MPSFQSFQNQAEQKSNKPKFSAGAFSLSGLMDYAESAKKQNFEAVCRLQPLVKTYRSKVEETSVAMAQAESSFEGEGDIPEAYTSALGSIKESFAAHLGALEEWMNVLTQKRESDSEAAIAKVKQSGQELETSLLGLSIPEQEQ